MINDFFHFTTHHGLGGLFVLVMAALLALAIVLWAMKALLGLFGFGRDLGGAFAKGWRTGVPEREPSVERGKTDR